MNKSKISFYFVFIAFFTFLAIFLTIVQASYNNLINPIKQVEDNKFLEPLNPALDSEVIKEIERRQNINEDEEVVILNNSNNINTPISITPTPTKPEPEELEETSNL
mgnify:CR=1 FL=1